MVACEAALCLHTVVKKHHFKITISINMLESNCEERSNNFPLYVKVTFDLVMSTIKH